MADILSFINRIDTRVLSSSGRNDSLQNGRLAFILYNLCYDSYFGTDIRLPVICDEFHLVIDSLRDESSTLRGYTLFNGLGGVGYISDCIKQVLPAKNFGGLFDELDVLLKSELQAAILSNEFDYMSGSFGLIRIYIKRRDVEFLQTLMDSFFSTYKADNFFILSSLSRNNDACINVGFAHGISAFLMILMDILELGINVSKIKAFLERGTEFLLSFADDDLSLGDSSPFSIFPDVIYADRSMLRRSRLAWCYGDSNISVLFYRAGQILSNQKLLSLASALMQRNALRRSYETTWCDTSLVCHGSSGLAVQFNFLVNRFGLSQFKSSADYWTERTIGFLTANFDKEAARFKETDILNGIAGVAMALLTVSGKTISNPWSELLHLS